jgi:hypothetical protein
MRRFIINPLLLVISSTLFLDLCFWGLTWLMEKPFDKMGWLRIYIDMVNFNNCDIRMEYFMQSLFLLVLVAIHGVIIFIIVNTFGIRSK